MVKVDEAVVKQELGQRLLSTSHLLKYWRREMREEFKRVVFQIKLMCFLDPAIRHDVERFHISEPLNRFFEAEYGLQSDTGSANGISLDLDQLLKVAKPVPGKAARRSLKLMRRQLRSDICRLVEKAQLLRVLDPAFDAEVHHHGWTRTLDTIARWHARGGWDDGA